MPHDPRFGRPALRPSPRPGRTDHQAPPASHLLDGASLPSMLRGALPETPITTGPQTPDDDPEDPHPGSDGESPPDEPEPQPSPGRYASIALSSTEPDHEVQATARHMGGC